MIHITINQGEIIKAASEADHFLYIIHVDPFFHKKRPLVYLIDHKWLFFKHFPFILNVYLLGESWLEFQQMAGTEQFFSKLGLPHIAVPLIVYSKENLQHIQAE